MKTLKPSLLISHFKRSAPSTYFIYAARSTRAIIGICSLLALLLTAYNENTYAQAHTSDYRIFDTKQSKEISLQELQHKLQVYDVVFFGEEHNDSIAHVLELEIYKALAHDKANKVLLSLEMFHSDVQSVLEEYLQGMISEKNFIKEARAWNNYKDYKPLIEYAKSQQLGAFGVNAASRYSNVVTLKGLQALNNFSNSSKQHFAPLPIDTATGRYYEKFLEILGGHGTGGMHIYQTQNFWDATMAWHLKLLAEKYKKHSILHLNGRFHSDEGLGTYAQLKKYAPKLKLTNISVFSDASFSTAQWAQFKHLGDFIIITNPEIKRTF